MTAREDVRRLINEADGDCRVALLHLAVLFDAHLNSSAHMTMFRGQGSAVREIAWQDLPAQRHDRTGQ